MQLPNLDGYVLKICLQKIKKVYDKHISSDFNFVKKKLLS